MIDREEFFQMLLRKEWDQIAKAMYKNSSLIESDPIFKNATMVFESEFFAETEDLAPNEQLKLFEYPGLIIELGKHAFSKAFVDRFIDKKLLLLKSEKPNALLSYAASNQHRPLAREILKEIKDQRPETVADAKRESISIKATATEFGKPLTISLFKSKQEQNFFEAIREAFPTYHPYPNVALSCIIDFNAVKNKLTTQEREYFFRAIIDCVVFDTKHEYEPKYFFELDSSYHDSSKAKENDSMKDAIFVAANTKLIRIRSSNSEETSVKKLRDLVLEIMRHQ